MKISVDWIDADPQQPRRHFAGIEELAESIKHVGLQQPITVRPVEGRYIIISGERRWPASKRSTSSSDCVTRPRRSSFLLSRTSSAAT